LTGEWSTLEDVFKLKRAEVSGGHF